MIIGTHFLLYSNNADADRTFFRDVLGFPCVDAGEGWLIFGMSPAEAGIHPLEGESSQQHGGQQMLGGVLYLMCDDLNAQTAALRSKGVQCSEEQDAGWGITTTIALPSGGRIGLYRLGTRPHSTYSDAPREIPPLAGENAGVRDDAARDMI